MIYCIATRIPDILGNASSMLLNTELIINAEKYNHLFVFATETAKFKK